jgi:hypothetical protein
LEEIRIDANERLLVLFTTAIDVADVHYLDYPSMPGYVGCNGTDCLLCKIGRKLETRDCLPAYDLLAKKVGVVPVTTNMRPGALKPQLIPHMDRVAKGERYVLAVRKLDKYRFGVESLALQENADDGAQQMAVYQKEYEAGAISPASIYSQVTNEVIASLPEVKTMMAARGITL